MQGTHVLGATIGKIRQRVTCDNTSGYVDKEGLLLALS